MGGEGGALLSFSLVLVYNIVSCFIFFHVCYVCSHSGIVTGFFFLFFGDKKKLAKKNSRNI